VDGSRCISYLTIELKDAIPSTFAGKMDNWVFGCDVCQDVCPWNRFSKPHQEPAFHPSSELEALAAQDWRELTEETFNKVFSGSAFTRTKLKGITRNLEFLTQEKPAN
jgi:epoxyqueuosine reductase